MKWKVDWTKMEKEKGKGRHDIYGSSNRKDITGRQLREIDKWRRNRGGTISECILRNFFPSRLIFLILWLIPPRWVHRSEVHRSPTTWRTTIHCDSWSPSSLVFLSFPSSFFSISIDCFFSSPFPSHTIPVLLLLSLPEKMHKGSSSFQSRRMRRKCDKRPWSRVKRSGATAPKIGTNRRRYKFSFFTEIRKKNY